jgi:hypothetical protein
MRIIKNVFALVGIVALLVMAVKAIQKDICGDSDYFDLVSPNRLHNATLYVRGCGATTDFTTIVELDGTEIFASEGLLNAEKQDLIWADNTTLQVEYVGTQDNIVFFKDASEGVKIRLVPNKR